MLALHKLIRCLTYLLPAPRNSYLWLSGESAFHSPTGCLMAFCLNFNFLCIFRRKEVSKKKKKKKKVKMYILGFLNLSEDCYDQHGKCYC